VVHDAALPFEELPAFLTALHARHSMATTALEFAILTAARNRRSVGRNLGRDEGLDRAG
jgi:hypothetical protein